MENKIRYQFDRLPMVLFLACLVVTAVAGSLSYGKDQTGKVIYKIGKPIFLSCNGGDQNDKIEWKKDDKLFAKNSEAKERYSIIGKEGSFSIGVTNEHDAGEYSCWLKDDHKEFSVYASVIVKIPENIYVIEEEKLDITCIVKGTDPKVSWEFRAENETEAMVIPGNDTRYKLIEHDNVKDSRLQIEKSMLSDRGYFTCIGWNDDSQGEKFQSEGFVRVKDKLAALWPFLGIVAEVFVLCAIILIYEKRRNKTDLDESDTDQSPDQKNDHQKDVRHRK